MRAEIDGRPYAVGGPALLRELGATVPEELTDPAAQWSRRGAAVLRLDGEKTAVIGAFGLEDEVRPEARAAIDQLRPAGVRKIVMITGDARPVAADLGFRPRRRRDVRRGAAGRQGPSRP